MGWFSFDFHPWAERISSQLTTWVSVSAKIFGEGNIICCQWPGRWSSTDHNLVVGSRDESVKQLDDWWFFKYSET